MSFRGNKTMAQKNDLLPASKQLSVLIIDPNSALREHLASELREYFLHVDETSNAYEAISFSRINNYDIILLDEAVANLTPIQLIENFLEHNPKQAMIFFAEAKNLETIIKVSNKKICSIVTKPMNVSKFYDEMLTICKRLDTPNTLLDETHYAKQKKANLEKVGKRDLLKQQLLADELKALKERNEKLEVQNKTLSDRLNKVQYFNTITTLENRESLQHTLRQAGEKALIYLNINRFDLINTLYGMAVGNGVLKAVAESLAQLIPSESKLFNINVDEFAVLLMPSKPQEEFTLATAFIQHFIDEPLKVKEHSFDIRFSVGIAKGESMALFGQAKIASQEAKYFASKAPVYFTTDSEYIKKQRSDLYWMRHLQSAIEQNRLICHYQPIIENIEGSIAYFEVLCRLKQSDGTLINAGRFIDAAKEVGLATKLTKVMIENACEHFSHNSYKFSINICDADIYEEYLLEYIKKCTEKYSIHPSRIHLEMSANSALDSSDILLKQIEMLHEFGISFGLDDARMDHTMLHEMSVDFIKIDKGLIRDIESNSNNEKLIKLMVEFAKLRGVKTVAEQIESRHELQAVSNLGVDYAQGYFIGKPKEDTLY